MRAIWLERFGSRGRSGKQGQGEIPAEQLERSVGGGDVLRVDLVGRAADLDLLGDSDFESALPREGHEYRELAGGPLDGLLFPLLGEEGEYQWWRFRIHARGRDAASQAGDIHAEEGGTVLEQHLVQIWAASQAPETRHRLTDEVGRRRRTASPEEYEAAKAAEAAHEPVPPTPPEEMPMAPVRAELHTRTPDTPAD